MIASVDTGQLFELVWSAALAGIFVATAFSLTLLGATRATDHRREGRARMAAGHLALAIVASIGVIAAVIFGVSIIVSK